MKDSWKRILSISIGMGSALYFITYWFMFISVYVKYGVKKHALIALVMYTIQIIVINKVLNTLKIKKNKYKIND